MPKKKEMKIEFEEGWSDELLEDDELTQEDIDALMRGIMELVATGEIFEDATPIEDLSEEEQEEIRQMFERREKRTRH